LTDGIPVPQEAHGAMRSAPTTGASAGRQVAVAASLQVFQATAVAAKRHCAAGEPGAIQPVTCAAMWRLKPWPS